MKASTLKNALLAGSAIVAVSFAAPASAATLTLNASDTWADGGVGPLGASAAEDDVNVTTAATTLTITNDGVSDDGGGVNAFTLGNVTESGVGAGTITITSGAAADLTVEINDAVISGDFNVTGDDGDDSTIAVTLTDDLDVGGALNVTTDEADAADSVSLTVGDDLTVDGATTITAAAGAGAGGNATLTVGGNATFTGGATLDDDTGLASLVLNGASAQTVTGAIDGDAGGEGTIVVNNANGATFTGKVGDGAGLLALNVGTADGANSSATFENTLSAAAITLGNGGATADTNTLTFDSTDNDFTVTGTIDGSAVDTDALVVNGGGVVTIAGKVGNTTAVDTFAVGSNTQAIVSNTVLKTVSGVTLASGSELNLTGAATVTGDINGNGTLDIDNAVTVVGDIGDSNDLTAIEILTGKVLTVDAATAAEDVTVDATTITLEGAAAGITVAQGAQAVTFSADIDTAADGAGAIIVGDGAGTVNFQSLGASTAASLASLVVTNGAGVQAINVNGDLFVDAITLNTSDTLNLLGSSGTVSGTVVGGAAARGAIVVGDGASASNYTFSGAIGGTAVGSFTVKAESTANLVADVATKASGAGVAGIDIDSGATLNVDTDTGVVAISDAVGDIDIDGTVSITGANNATITAADDIFIDGASTFTSSLDATKTLTITSTGDDIDIGHTSDTTIVADNEVVINGNVNFATTAAAIDDRVVTIRTGSTAFDATAAYVFTAAGDTLDYDGDAVVRYGINSGYTGLEDGDIILFVNSNENATLDTVAKTYVELETAGAVELIDTGFVDFSVSAAGDEAQDLEVLATFNDANDAVDDSVASAAQALIDFPTATGELLEARGNLLAAAPGEDAQNAAESLASDLSGGAQLAALAFVEHTGQISSTRLSALRTGSTSGVAAGEMGQGNYIWAQVFGTHGSQDDRDGVDGFDFDSIGVALGADSENFADNTTLGALVSYAGTDVESDNATSAETDINSFQIALYGDYDFGDRMYVAGQVGYAFGANDTTRYNVGGISGLTATGDYDSNQFQVRAEVGKDYAVDNATVTPKLLADYVWYSADDYTETGAGAANLNVDSDSVNVFNLGVGADVAWAVKHNNGSWCEPALHGAVKYDLANDNVETTSSFTGGGASFQTQGADPGRLSADVGASLTFHSATNWDVKAQYDFEWKEDFTSHSGLLKAGYKF